MNREIKLRAWDKEGKRFLEFSLTGLSYASDIGTVNIKDWEDLVQVDDLGWQQFTGLKDKNGKEIYEGDIVEKLSAKGWRLGEVRFHHGAFVVKYPEVKGWKLLSERGQQSIKVIGNIYENPELLGMPKETL